MSGTQDLYQKCLEEVGVAMFGDKEAEKKAEKEFMKRNDDGIDWDTNRWKEDYVPVGSRYEVEDMVTEILDNDTSGLQSESDYSLRSLDLADYDVESTPSDLSDQEWLEMREEQYEKEMVRNCVWDLLKNVVENENKEEEMNYEENKNNDDSDSDEEPWCFYDDDECVLSDQSEVPKIIEAEDSEELLEKEQETESFSFNMNGGRKRKRSGTSLEKEMPSPSAKKRNVNESAAGTSKNTQSVPEPASKPKPVSKPKPTSPDSTSEKIEDVYKVEPLSKSNHFDIIFTHKMNVIIDPKLEGKVLDTSELYGLVIYDIAKQSGLMEKPVRIGFKLNNYNDEEGDNEFSIRLKNPSELSPAICNLELESKVHSGTDRRPSYGGKFHLTIQAYKVLSGSGKTIREIINKQLIMHGDMEMNKNGKLVNKKNFVIQNNAATHCLGVAVLQGIRYFKKKETHKTDKSYRDRCTELHSAMSIDSAAPTKWKKAWTAAKELLTNAGITQATDFTVETDLQKLQDSLPAYRIVVVRGGKNKRITRPVFNGDLSPSVQNVPAKRQELALSLEDDHYMFIRRLATYFNARYYCVDCGVRYNNVKSHYKCVNRCTMCLSDQCQTKQDGFNRLAVTIPCPSCMKTFVDEDCYNRHLERGPRGGKSRCSSVIQCPRCRDRYYDTYPHKCGEKYCARCQCSREFDHHCTMQTMKPRKKESDYKRLFFDCETEAIDTPAGKQHKIVNVFTIKTCRHCCDSLSDIVTAGSLPPCDVCCPDGEPRFQEFQRYQPGCEGNDVGAQFVEFLFSSKHDGFTAIAHNLKGYDGMFILKELDRSTELKPKILIMNGRKLMGLEASGVKVIDSLSYVQAPLKSFPKTFGFADLAQKGDFPYSFISESRFSYIGKMPDFEYYMPDRLCADEKKKLKEWHDEQVAADYVFSFRDEIRKYTLLDTAILAIAMMRFEIETYKDTKVTIFEESWTAASAAMVTFRRGHLKPNTMVLDPSPKYSGINQSVLATRQLSYLSKLWGVNIQHKFNGGEKRVGKSRIFLDGYVEPNAEHPRGLAIEIKGCYYHACSCKYEASEVIRDGKTAQEIRDADARREAEILKHMDLKIIFEHEIRSEMRSNPEVAKALNETFVPSAIDLRSSLFGGRNEVLKLLAEADIHTILLYLDVTSLYPFIMKTRCFMKGPSIYVHPDNIPVPIRSPEELKIKELVCCDVLPPVGNDRTGEGFIPVLPFRRDGKLLFSLCSKCSSNDEKCSHTDDERKITGTYTHIELRRALEEGYVITSVWGAQHWDEWVQYSNSLGYPQDGLFSSYVNLFLKIKQEASGWPEGIETDAQKDAYLLDYLNHEGIHLEKDKISFNPVRRAVAKMFLNSLWGKFAEKKGRQSHHYVDSAEEFYELLSDKTREVKDILEMSEERVLVIMDSLPGYSEPGLTSTMPYAIYVTSYARDYLYEMLKAVPPEDLIYMDTDSLVLSHAANEPNPLRMYIGNKIGDLTSEVPSNSRMTRFTTVGCKSYSYETVDESGNKKITTKTKGFRKNLDSESKLTFELMEKQVQQVLRGEEPEKVTVNYNSIVRDRAHNLYTKEEEKQFGFTFNKRLILKDNSGSTRPFGYYY